MRWYNFIFKSALRTTEIATRQEFPGLQVAEVLVGYSAGNCCRECFCPLLEKPSRWIRSGAAPTSHGRVESLFWYSLGHCTSRVNHLDIIHGEIYTTGLLFLVRLIISNGIYNFDIPHSSWVTLDRRATQETTFNIYSLMANFRQIPMNTFLNKLYIIPLRIQFM